MAQGPSNCRLALVAALVAATPFAAFAGVPVGLYPVQSDGLTEGERVEVQSVVESALNEADRRGVLAPRTPLVLPGSCKPPITVGCVATLAKGGVVLYAKAKRRGAQILVTVLFVDAVGRKTRAAAFPVDLFIQNMRPANDAIATIEAELAAGALEDPTPLPAPPRPPAERPRIAERAPVPLPPPPEERPAAPQPAPVPAEPRAETPAPQPAATPPGMEPEHASVPIDLTPQPKAEPTRPPRGVPEKAPAAAAGGDWRRSAGRWCTGGGVAMLVAGAVVGLTGQRLGDALSDRYEKGELRPGDAKLFDRVDRYETVANVLFAAGGVSTAAGLGFFIMAPSGGGAAVAVAGSF